MLVDSELNGRVIDNFMNVKLWSLLTFFLLLVLLFYITKGSNFSAEYIESQKILFFFINSKLSQFPNLLLNITQLGDALIFFPIAIVFLYNTPKFWEVLLTSSIITLIASAALKRILAVPRPAAIYDVDSFVIIGRTLKGNTSFPSGHSITAFMVITILLYAFMPKKKSYKIVWSILILTVGFSIAYSRVGVGAHYPFDVLVGSAIGYLAAIIGIKINNNLCWMDWIKNKRFKPVFMLLLILWAFLILKKISTSNLPIFYMSLMSLVVTLFLITNAYVKKN